MNRLQVGGLALCTLNGLVCKLIGYFGDGYNPDGQLFKDNWLVEYNEFVKCEYSGKKTKILYEQSKYLLPLGDQKGVEIFKLEKENCDESKAEN